MRSPALGCPILGYRPGGTFGGEIGDNSADKAEKGERVRAEAPSSSEAGQKAFPVTARTLNFPFKKDHQCHAVSKEEEGSEGGEGGRLAVGLRRLHKRQFEGRNPIKLRPKTWDLGGVAGTGRD